MKRLLLLGFPLLLQFQTGNTQTLCGNPASATTLSANNIKARINNGGDLFFDGSDGIFSYQPAAGTPSSIFAAALWMGGVDPGGNLKLSALTYRLPNKTEYAAGPLDPVTGTTDADICANWDKVFSTTRQRVLDFKANLATWIANPQAAIAQYPDIMGWPGMDNPHFQEVNGFVLPSNQGLAPFTDANNDGVYNPLMGDAPAVQLAGQAPFLPTQLNWSVFNDVGAAHQASGGNSIGMEVQLTSWAFESADAPLNNTIFTSHKMIYRGFENVDSFFVGIWADFDLGCYLDDYIGCNPGTRTFYAYNQDAVDGQPGVFCNGTPTFGTETPVQSATFLDRSFDKFIYFDNPSVGTPLPAYTDPQLPIEYYNYLTGRLKDGSGINQGSPDSVSYVFPDDPSDPNGWSMCTAGSSFADRRVVASSKFGLLQPGAVNQLTTAWILHPNIPGPCSIAGMTDDVEVIQDIFDQGFSGITPVHIPGWASGVKVAPNPAADEIVLQFPGVAVQSTKAFDLQGRLMYSSRNTSGEMQRVAVQQWPAGTYIFQLATEKETLAVRAVVQH